ncbi:hypothetical protein THIOKS1470004 [Thiocapsa sp. KS1]|nr:hypothetical protein THIOKS1470004 [Thiocapsa sp. KS1]
MGAGRVVPFGAPRYKTDNQPQPNHPEIQRDRRPRVRTSNTGSRNTNR